MRPDHRFVRLPRRFWANVRSISQHVGYTVRGRGQIRAPDLGMIVQALRDLELGTGELTNNRGRPTTFGTSLVAYFAYRAEVLHKFVRPRLMNAKEAAAALSVFARAPSPGCPFQ